MHDETLASDPAGDRPVTATPQGAAPIDPAVHAAALARIALLESRLARAEEETRALVGSMHHAAAAAERLLTEAGTEADALRAAAARELHATREQIRAHREAYLAEVQQQAAQMLAEAQATAHELVVVARADAREALHQERRRVAHELEMLAAVRERIGEERRSLTHFHSQLSGRLRQLVQAMVEFSDQPEALGEARQFASTVLTGPQRPGPLTPADPTPVAEPAMVAEPQHRPFPSADRSGIHADDEQLDEAFDAFFSSDVDHEPSRRWILED